LSADWFLEDDAALAAEGQLQVAKLAASMLDD
jgi:streptomycin 6-kinase